MAKRKRSQSSEDKSLDSTDSTRPDMGESALMAAVDQHEATARGDANEPSDPPSDEEPSTETKSEEPAEKKAPPHPKGGVNAIPLRVFVQVGGLKWDQLAGFKSHAKRNKLGPMTVQEWRKLLADFQSKPIK